MLIVFLLYLMILIGGFGQQMLNAWGEPRIKAFVQEAVAHSLRLGESSHSVDYGKADCAAALFPIRDIALESRPPSCYST